MSILKIRDADGNVQEILAIKGDNYVLTQADKEEIAGMVDVDTSELNNHIENKENPHEVTAEQVTGLQEFIVNNSVNSYDYNNWDVQEYSNGAVDLYTFSSFNSGSDEEIGTHSVYVEFPFKLKDVIPFISFTKSKSDVYLNHHGKYEDEEGIYGYEFNFTSDNINEAFSCEVSIHIHGWKI